MFKTYLSMMIKIFVTVCV